MAEFKAGDVVCLKSGGPNMTVKWEGESEYEGYVVCCVWFEQPKNTLKTETFAPETLRLA